MSINLSKGQSINLAKRDGGVLTAVRMGLGWDAKIVTKKGLFGGTKQVQKAIDLDASAIMLGDQGVLETVYFGNLRSRDASVQHTGDNLSGAGDGDDESIVVALSGVSPAVKHIVFVVNSFSGDTFESIDNAYVRVVDPMAGDAELVRYTLSESGNFTAMVMAKVSRDGAGWAFTAIGRPGQGRVAKQLEGLALESI